MNGAKSEMISEFGVRQWLALGVAIVIALGGVYWSLLGGAVLFGLQDWLVGAGPPGTNTNTGFQARYDVLVFYYRYFFFPGLGLAVALLLWKPGYSTWKENVVALALLALALPAFSINILMHDQLIRLWVQGLLDVVVAICAMYFVIVLVRQRFKSLLTTIAKYVLVGILFSFFVLVPIFYAVYGAQP
ncbi:MULTISPECIES: hypothetical protein [Mesorhizobium]|uniref:hypothetical protein n=1 Tax=Mesorhizobium TaxID=68287 RepID=UPI0007EC5D5B|nr:MULTISPECIES: hypothetical protein [Mesorhizobium]PBB51921.1 hypothetical protein CK223_32380 [Mesorhizobium loti]QIA25555.1 hypothetical protein A9K68_030585 [Mesorhizobium sp. AA22]